MMSIRKNFGSNSSDNDDDGNRLTTISVTKQTVQLLTNIKSRKALSSMEAVIEWLFVHLDETASGEMRDMADYLHVYPPFASDEELRSHFSFKHSDEKFDEMCDELVQGIIAEELTMDRKKNVSINDIMNYMSRKDDERRKEGRAERFYPFYDVMTQYQIADLLIDRIPKVEIEEKVDD